MSNRNKLLLSCLLCCCSQYGYADVTGSLAQNSFTHIDSKPAGHTAMQNRLAAETSAMQLLQPQSTLENLIELSKQIQSGGGLLGKNVSPIISKDVIGLEYSAQW